MPLGRAIVWNKLVPKGSMAAFSACRSHQVLPMCIDSTGPAWLRYVDGTRLVQAASGYWGKDAVYE